MRLVVLLVFSCSHPHEPLATARSDTDTAATTAPDAAPAPVPDAAPAPTAAPAPVPVADPFTNPCRSGQSIAVFHSPRRPTTGDELRIIAVSETPIPAAALVARAPDGHAVRLVADAKGGPPWSWVAVVERPVVGAWRIGLVDGDRVGACRGVDVRARASGLGGSGAVWQVEKGWDRASENLYSAWIERLFAAPPDAHPRWTPLHAVTRDRTRNFLWNHVGLGEDDAGNPKAIVLDADCADTPYFLRAYFAWKMRLPFQFSTCEAPEGSRIPACRDPVTNAATREAPLELDAMQAFLRRLADTAHSGSVRTLPDDDASDFYPRRLTREALRPGTVYADPHGHVLVIVGWQPAADGGSGTLWAIDGNPDRHVGRKKFWRGTFGFVFGTWAGAPGFKGFRPLASEAGTLRPLTNAEIRGSRAYADYSPEENGLRPDAFYDRIERLITPEPIDATRAFDETLDLFHDQVRDRVDAVQEGETWLGAHAGTTIPMPPGAEIFATEAGPWEDYSTPSRDLQLLIAMDVLVRFPDRLVGASDRFVLPPGRVATDVAADLRARLATETTRRTIEYERSDGSTQRLTLADVIARKTAFEMAYNPNDCVETRWGAPDATPEHATCRRVATDGQRARMRLYRTWFAQRRRPPRP